MRRLGNVSHGQFGRTTSIDETAREFSLPRKIIADTALSFGYTDSELDEFQIADVLNRIMADIVPGRMVVMHYERKRTKAMMSEFVHSYLKSLGKPTKPVVIGKTLGMRSVSVLNALMPYSDVAEEDDGSLFVIEA